jgi:hypothetical protein
MAAVFEAAHLLEQRKHFEQVPFERYTEELWALIDEKLPGYAPRWYRELTMRFRIGGAGFKLEVEKGVDWKGSCTICRPSHALWFAYHPMTAWVVEGMFKHRFVFFAREDDYYDYGWAFRDDGNPNPDVYFFERSAWDGGEASENNGLLRIGMTMSELLTFGARWLPAKPASK